MINTYGFLVAHGYRILKGYLDAENEKDAEIKILNGDWIDIINDYDSDEFIDGYEIIEIYE